MAKNGLWLRLSKWLGRAYWESELDEEICRREKAEEIVNKALAESKTLEEDWKCEIDKCIKWKESYEQLEEENRETYMRLTNALQKLGTKDNDLKALEEQLKKVQVQLYEAKKESTEVATKLSVRNGQYAKLEQQMKDGVKKLQEEKKLLDARVNLLEEMLDAKCEVEADLKKKVLSLQGVNGRYRKTIERLKAEIEALRRTSEDETEE